MVMDRVPRAARTLTGTVIERQLCAFPWYGY